MKKLTLLIVFTLWELTVLSAQNMEIQAFLPASASHFSERFDPSLCIVEDPNIVTYAELPSGDVNLKTYSAPFSVIKRYALLHGVSGGDIKDFPLAPNCTRAEIDALKRWTYNDDVYPLVNKALRFAQKGKINGVPIDEKTELEALVIASAVNCIPSFQGAVNRIETAPSFILDQYKTGNLLVFRGFTSTTKGNTPLLVLQEVPDNTFLFPMP